MNESKSQEPYRALGSKLKLWREKLHESIAEVSGAVEINDDVLEKIEKGTIRPSEDVLQLLINHFNIAEEEADTLWDLAGFDRDKQTGANFIADALNGNSVVMVMPVMNPQIMYTDTAQITINNHGVVLNFLQAGGPNNQQIPVARVGMSKEHAKNLLELLQQTLNQQPSQPKLLPAPKNKQKPKDH